MATPDAPRLPAGNDEPPPVPAAVAPPPVAVSHALAPPVPPPVEPRPRSNAGGVASALPAAGASTPDKVAAPTAQARWFDQMNRALGFTTSMILHMVVLIAFGLWMLRAELRPMRVSLMATMGDDVGGSAGLETLDVGVDGSSEDAASLEEELAPAAVAADDAFAANTSEPQEQLNARLTSAPWADGPTAPGTVAGPPGQGGSGALAGRRAGARAGLVAGGGGSAESEAAVALGLRWLARHQHPDGNWGLDSFPKVHACRGRCSFAGGHSDTAATALALLPFLGAGHTPKEGEYRQVVERGLYWLLRAQRPDGDLRGPGMGRMYAHGQATIVLCEAYALTQDPELRDPAQRAVDFIIRAQHRGGGWRYTPGEPGDTSVVGWQVMALRSAQMAYLDVPDRALKNAESYLDRAQVDNYGGQYSYQPNGGPTPSMTAEALLCRQYGGWRPEHPGLQEGMRYLMGQHPPRASEIDIYYWYYGTQVMHHHGGRSWELWNMVVRDSLIAMQRKTGHEAGSWSPTGPLTASGGRIYMTSMALCTLEVYYRHMPLYRAMAVER